MRRHKRGGLIPNETEVARVGHDRRERVVFVPPFLGAVLWNVTRLGDAVAVFQRRPQRLSLLSVSLSVSYRWYCSAVTNA